MVPAEPFVNIVKRRLEVLRGTVPEVDVNAMGSVAFELGVGERTVQTLLYSDSNEITFEMADRIVTKLEGPMLWHEDHELSSIYWSVNLVRQDLMFPLDAPGPRQWAHERLIEAYDSHETKVEAAASLGLRIRAFTLRLDEALEAAGRETSPRVEVCMRGHNMKKVGRTKWSECMACYESMKEIRNARRRKKRAAGVRS